MTVSEARANGASTPPQNEEAEVAVLGTILMTEQALDQIFVDLRLGAEDFYRPRHQLIFRAMLRLKEKAEPEAVDAITVCDDLRREGKLEEAGGDGYVHSLPAMVPAAGAVRDYARIVREHSMLRRLLGAARDIQEKVATDSGDPRALVEQAEQAIFRAGHHEDGSQLRAIEDILHDELDKLERLSKEGQSLTGTPSGYRDLDEITGGFQPGNLIVLAARPAMGKSCLATNMAENAAVDHGKAVAMFSLEMSEGELAQRFIASRARINGESLRKGRSLPISGRRCSRPPRSWAVRRCSWTTPRTSACSSCVPRRGACTSATLSAC